ncbi:hypothetical protein BC941DRAFT_436331 [Chlamydoabsidia padenii]|nr:hypothetical protein BC941DRAFT_436331 [Chlamydoabsidia padenii]
MHSVLSYSSSMPYFFFISHYALSVGSYQIREVAILLLFYIVDIINYLLEEFRRHLFIMLTVVVFAFVIPRIL